MNSDRARNILVDRSKRYTDLEDFFSLHGSVVMKLTPEAAIAVCEQAAQRGLVVARIEGGIWHNPKFEARIDCIWDGADPPIASQAAHENNLSAIEFIRSVLPEHSAFIITAPPITGWER
ncbi:colicin immunity protein [Paraburkholderia solisilvae]|uniref:colicin immunity protein n=1 Tax=Paraburkholderia solisilvae TaxID=624376 RepID=UPI001FE2D174|nr:colicin immunity protein [Paraburkholderia solisilvae]